MLGIGSLPDDYGSLRQLLQGAGPPDLGMFSDPVGPPDPTLVRLYSELASGAGDLRDLMASSSGDDALYGSGASDPGADWLQRAAAIESGYNRAAVHPLSGATGLLQFLPSTWRGVMRNFPQLGLTEADIGDPQKQAIAARTLLDREVIPGLRKALGREPTPQEIYTAWGLGTPDATKLFKAVQADPNAPAAPMFRENVSKWNPNFFFNDKDMTQPKSVAEVAQAYANTWNGAKQSKRGASMINSQPPEDLRGVGSPPTPQGGAGIGSLGSQAARPQMAGISALNPYMQIAAQLMPERGGSAIGDALINAGAAMMQSRSPDFLGGAGAGLAAGNQALQARRQGDRQDTLDRFKFGMQLAQYDQKDAGEWAVGEGVMFNKKTGEVRSVGGKAQSDLGKLQADLREGRIGPEEYQIAITKMRGENESPAMKVIRELRLDPNSPQAQKILQDYALRVGGGTTTNVDLRGEGKFAEETAKGEAAVFNDIKKGAMEAPQSNARLDRLGALLEDVQTGKFATSLSELQKGLNSIFGQENAPKVFGRPADVAKAEAAQALAREIALTLRNPAGGAGMPGALSDSDRKFLESMTPGLETTPQGRALMLDTARALNKRNVEVARLAQQYVKDNGGRFTGFEVFLADWSEKNPLFKPQEKPAQKPQATTAPAPTMTAPGSSLTVTTPNADGSTKTQQVPVGGAGMADRIRQMSRDEMLRLDMTKMTQEELKAAADRWEQINRAGGQ